MIDSSRLVGSIKVLETMLTYLHLWQKKGDRSITKGSIIIIITNALFCMFVGNLKKKYGYRSRSLLLLISHNDRFLVGRI